MINDLRKSMEQATSVGGVKIKPVARLSDATVVGWALALANAVMNPRLLIIDREKFLERLEESLAERLEAYEDAPSEQQRAMLELIVAGSADVSPYDTTAPLRAVPAEGEVS